MVGWRAYYRERTISSAEASHTDLPDGMLGVIEFLEPPYRKIVDGGDWYWFKNGRWHKSKTIWNGWVRKPRLKCKSCVKRGLALPDEDWAEVQRRMFEDRSWP